MQAVAERNSNIVLVQLDPDPTGETPFDQTLGVIVNTRARTVSEPAFVQSILERGYWLPFDGDAEPALALASSALTAAGYDESKHKRYPKGTKVHGNEGGGRFAPKEAGDQSDEEEKTGPKTHPGTWVSLPATNAVEAHYKATRPREAIEKARGWLKENGVEEHNRIPTGLLNDVGVVEAMQEHYPDGYEMFLSINGLHKDDYRNHWLQGTGDAYKPERALEHAAMRADAMKNAKLPANGEAPEALFMAGGPASGKSTILGNQNEEGNFEGGTIEAPRTAVYVNPDKMKEIFDETEVLREQGDWRWAMLAHEESSDVAKQLTSDTYAAGLPIVVDGTGDAEGPSDRFPEGKFVGKIREAEAKGYKTKVVLVDIPVSEAVKRAKARELSEHTGRKVSRKVVTDLHRGVAERHLEWRDKVDNWEVWANDDAEHGGRRIIARRVGGGAIEILEPKRYKQLEGKAHG